MHASLVGGILSVNGLQFDVSEFWYLYKMTGYGNFTELEVDAMAEIARDLHDLGMLKVLT